MSLVASDYESHGRMVVNAYGQDVSMAAANAVTATHIFEYFITHA